MATVELSTRDQYGDHDERRVVSLVAGESDTEPLVALGRALLKLVRQEGSPQFLEDVLNAWKTEELQRGMPGGS